MAKRSLRADGIRYSNSEQQAFQLLGTKPLTTLEITKKLYKKSVPHNARQAVLSVLSRLIRKAVANKEPFKIARSERRGPHPVEFWIDK